MTVREPVLKHPRFAPPADREPPRGGPCARCGVRPDVDCGHTASRLIGTMPMRPVFA